MAYLIRFIIHSCMIILFGFFISSCNSSVKKSENIYSIDLAELLNQLPVQNKVTRQLVTEELVRQAPESFEQICKYFGSENKDLKRQSIYALSLLTDYFGKTPNIEYSKDYQKALQLAITSDLSASDINFLLQQLGLCGGDDSLDFLIEYLYRDQLQDAVIRAMIEINSQKAATILSDRLEDLPLSSQLAVIKSLGELKYQDAGREILQFVDSDHQMLRKMARYSVANMGYLPAESILRIQMESNDIEEKKIAIDNFVLWVTNLDDANIKSRQIAEIINNKNELYLSHHRLTILDECAQNNCPELYDHLNFLLTENNQKLTIESLHMTGVIRDGKMTDWLIGQMNTSPIRLEIVRELGIRGDNNALPALYPGLSDTSYAIQKETIRSIRKLGGYDALFKQLSACVNEKLCDLLVQELVWIKKEDLISGITDIFSEDLNPKSKRAIIDIISKRKLNEHISLIRKSLNDNNIDVRIAAISTVATLEDQQSLETLIDGFFAILNEEEADQSTKSIIHLLRSSEERESHLKNLASNKSISIPSSNKNYLAVLKGVGGLQAYHMLQSEIQNPVMENSSEAFEVLYEWPDEFALDTLVLMANTSLQLREKVKAIRASLGILREVKLTDQIKMDYYRRIMPAASRTEEKQMVLAGVALIQSEEATDFLMGQLNDPDLRPTIIKMMAQILNYEESGYVSSKISQKLLTMQFPQDSIKKYFSEQIDPDWNQPPEGYVALFNGTDLSGWKGLVADPVQRKSMSHNQLDSLQRVANDDMRSHWFVDAGILRFDGGGKNLCTIKEYKNFELLVDWKIEKGGDSGIYLRGMPQVQIKDQYLDMGGSGGLYNNNIGENRPLEIADWEPGDWNRFHIIMKGNRVTVYLNRRLVVDNIRMENYWEREKEAYETGSIELQAHNSPLYFRNIYIKELPDSPKRDGKIFNGQDLSGWKVINSDKNSWQVEDNVLSTDGSGGGWLSTEAIYDDFELTIEFRVSPGGNSGIFLRAPHQGDPAYTGMEIQILDDYAEKYANLKPWQYTASIYGVQAAKPGNSYKSNQWQKIKIVCDGPAIQIELNNNTVIETNIIDHMWQTDTHPGLKRRSGFLGLQAHGSKVEFKNINIKELR